MTTSDLSARRHADAWNEVEAAAVIANHDGVLLGAQSITSPNEVAVGPQFQAKDKEVPPRVGKSLIDPQTSSLGSDEK